MISFECDYTTGTHPAILRNLIETNYEPLPGYGMDKYTESAKEKIRQACGIPDAEVEFITGGTQTNMTVISTILKDHEGVIAADTGHVSVHESGAIEFTGHKVLEIPGVDGKIRAESLEEFLKGFYGNMTHDHMVFPGMVYISHPTEFGTLYTRSELEAISGLCREYGLTLYMDGARLGYGLMSNESDLTLKDVAELTDVFYIGGTKVGALCGEAVVFTGGSRPEHFMTSMKRRGALLAKGRLLGIQFDTLFTDDLYFRISRHAIEMAEKLKEIIIEKGWTPYMLSPTNQQFVILSDEEMKELAEYVRFDVWDRYDENSCIIRLATSWSTTDEDLDVLRGYGK